MFSILFDPKLTNAYQQFTLILTTSSLFSSLEVYLSVATPTELEKN